LKEGYAPVFARLEDNVQLPISSILIPRMITARGS